MTIIYEQHIIILFTYDVIKQEIFLLLKIFKFISMI